MGKPPTPASGVGDGADPCCPDQDGLGAVVVLREENRATRPLFDAVVNMHRHADEGTASSTVSPPRHGTTRAEIMRIAVDRFLLELAELRLGVRRSTSRPRSTRRFSTGPRTGNG
ncbi:hypothetical protein GS943_23260 [Rhodococcus hoagii]|nr:hypothetical protein [Prescottella equi]